MPIHRARLTVAAFALSLGCGGSASRSEPRSDARPKEEKVEDVQPSATSAQRGAADQSDRAQPAPQGFAVLSAPAAAPTPLEGQPVAAPAPAPPPSSAASDSLAPGARMVIRTGVASVEVDSLDRAVAQVRAIATRLGGFVANATLQTGRDQVRSASLELKLPAPRFDDAVAGLSPVGRVETVNVTAEDVGEEYVDVAARVANSRRLEARLIALLERDAGRLSDVLAVERELARVREEIERAEGRLRYLRTQVALSTLTVTVHEAPPIIGTSPTANPIGDAFTQAWRNFVGFVAGLIALSGVLVPLAALVALAIWIARRAGWKRPALPTRPARRPVPPEDRKDA